MPNPEESRRRFVEVSDISKAREMKNRKTMECLYELEEDFISIASSRPLREAGAVNPAVNVARENLLEKMHELSSMVRAQAGISDEEWTEFCDSYEIIPGI